VSELPDGIPIKDLTFSELQGANVAGWVYPRRSISPCIPLFSKTQQAALNLYGWVAMLMVPAGIGLAIYFGSWWWLLLMPGAYLVWKANRKTMEQFFLENLKGDRAFYEAIQKSSLGDLTKVVVQK
jgi:hypothetical protein